MRLRVPKNRREVLLRGGDEVEEGCSWPSSWVLSGRLERTEAILRMLREKEKREGERRGEMRIGEVKFKRQVP